MGDEDSNEEFLDAEDWADGIDDEEYELERQGFVADSSDQNAPDQNSEMQGQVDEANEEDDTEFQLADDGQNGSNATNE